MMTARLSRAAWLRATGQRPEHCPEASEFQRGLEAYHRGAELDDDQPIAWRTGWRAGRDGRQLPRREAPTVARLWEWLDTERLAERSEQRARAAQRRRADGKVGA